MATVDKPEKITIGGAGYKYWSLIIPIVVFVTFVIISFVFPDTLPPGNIATTAQIDPATGQPYPLELDVLLIVALINGSLYGGVALILDLLYILRKK